MGAPQLHEDRIPAASLGAAWVELEEHAQAGAFAQVRAVAATIAKGLEDREDAEAQSLRGRLKDTIEYGRNRAFEVGMEAVGRSFMGLYEAAATLQGDAAAEPKKTRRRRRARV